MVAGIDNIILPNIMTVEKMVCTVFTFIGGIYQNVIQKILYENH